MEKKNFKKLSKFAQGKDAAMRAEAIEGMGKVDCEESFNFLTGAIRSPDAQVREAAAKGLGALKNDKARAFLDHQLAGEDNENVAVAIRDALAHIRMSQ